MAMAPEATETGGSGAHITASYLDRDRLYLVFNIALDADLPPLPADMAVIVKGERFNVISLDIQLQEDHSVVALLVESPLAEDAAFILQYRPSQWLMCDEATGDAIDAFDEELIPQSIELLDPSLRLKSDLAPSEESTTSQTIIPKEVEATISSASEYIIQLSFNAALDSSIPLEATDFRAELEDRWLKITSAKYINSHKPNWPEIRLELSEPMEVNERVSVGYRSPSNRLRTLEAETLASFNVQTKVARTLGRNLSDDEADLESVAVSKAVSDKPAATASEHVGDSPELIEEEPLAETEKETHDPILDELDDIAESISEELEDNDEVVAIETDEDLLILEAAETTETDEAPAEESIDQADDVSEEANMAAVETESQPQAASSENPEIDQDESEDALQTANDTIVTPAVSEEVLAEQVKTDPQEDTKETEIENVEANSEAEATDASASSEQQDEDSASETNVSTGGKNLAAKLGELNNGGKSETGKAPVVTATKKTRAETIAEKAARIQKALESKTEMPEPNKEPESLTARLIYIVPAVIFVWLLIVVFVYVSSIVFDLDFASSSPEPVVVLPAEKMPKEQCSVKSNDGSSYEGECVNGKREGFGTYVWPTGNRYEGQWLAGKRHGKGKLIFSGGGQYEGDFRSGVEEGRGKMLWPNGAYYEGEYRNGRFHGQGKYRSADGSVFDGVFEDGNMTQNGVCTLVSGERRPGPCGG